MLEFKDKEFPSGLDEEVSFATAPIGLSKEEKEQLIKSINITLDSMDDYTVDIADNGIKVDVLRNIKRKLGLK